MTGSRVPPHAFDVLDRTGQPVPPEPYSGDMYCGACNLPGEPGDARHPLDAPPATPAGLPPTPPDAREVGDRILGETGG